MAAATLLASCAPPAASEATEPEALERENAFVCPAGPYLDCMPLVPRERQLVCSPPYRDWIAGHCPGVTVTY
jgi:hypothetical protein